MRFLIILLFLTLSNPGHSQNAQVGIDKYKNAFYFEAGGNGFIYSLNYERRFYVREKLTFTGRVGAATLLREFPYILPVELNYLIGKKTNYFEVGFGRTFLQEEGYNVLRLGYRHENENKNRVFRAAFTPLLGVISDDIISSYPWLGISYGIRF